MKKLVFSFLIILFNFETILDKCWFILKIGQFGTDGNFFLSQLKKITRFTLETFFLIVSKGNIFKAQRKKCKHFISLFIC